MFLVVLQELPEINVFGVSRCHPCIKFLVDFSGIWPSLFHSLVDAVWSSLDSFHLRLFFNSMDAPRKLVPLSDLMECAVPRLEINLLRAWMKESVNIAFTTCMWTVLLGKQVNKAQYRFKSDLLSQITKGPKIFTPQWVNGGASMHLSFGKSAIFWYLNAPRSLQHVTHLKIVLHTTELVLITQRPFFWRLFSVILLPLCGTFWRHHVTIASVINFAFCKITGCTSLISTLIFLIYHQFLELNQYLGKDPIWKDCLIYVLLYLVSMKKFHDWMNVVAAS